MLPSQLANRAASFSVSWKLRSESGIGIECLSVLVASLYLN